MTDLNLNISGADEYPRRLRLLIAGSPGAGLTEVGALFPNPIFAKSGVNLTALGRLGGVPYVNINGVDDLRALKKALDRPSEEREALLGLPVDTLVFDVVDEFQRLVMDERLKSKGRAETDGGDWGWIAKRFHSIFTGLNQLDLDIVYLVHTKNVNDTETVKPAIGGAFSEGIHEYVDHSALLRSVSVPSGPVATGESVSSELWRYLIFWPQDDADWVHDKTDTLPTSLIAREGLPEQLRSYRLGVTLRDSEVREVKLVTAEPVVVVPDEVPEQTVETAPETPQTEASVASYECSNCRNTFPEQAWADLSTMRFKRVLCGPCYKETDK